MARSKGMPVAITGGLRSALDLKARLEKCIAIQTAIRDRVLHKSPDFTNTQATLDLLIACLDSNATDIAKYQGIVSKHKRTYNLK